MAIMGDPDPVPNSKLRFFGAVEEETLEVLKEIRDLLKKVIDTKPDEEPILIDDSRGTCPQCNSSQVTFDNKKGLSYYGCTDCGTVWVNDEEALK